MEIAKDKERIVIAVRCTRDEISDAITVLEALRKDMPVDNRPHFPRYMHIDAFLENIRRRGVPEELCANF